MKKQLLKTTLLNVEVLFLSSANAAQQEGYSTSPAYGISIVSRNCSPPSVTVSAVFHFTFITHASVDSFRVVTEFWRYDIGVGQQCQSPANANIAATRTSPAIRLDETYTYVSEVTFYGNTPVQANVQQSGYYQAKSYLQKLSGGTWNNVPGLISVIAGGMNPFVSEWSHNWYENGQVVPDRCCLVAPYVAIMGKNQDSLRFSVNEISALPPGTAEISPPTLTRGTCKPLYLHHIGGNGSSITIKAYRGTWTSLMGGGGGGFVATDSTYADYEQTTIVNGQITDSFDLAALFPNFFNQDAYYRITVQMDKNECDAGIGTVTKSRVYKIVNTPTISNLKVNNTAVVTNCTTTFAASQQVYACNPILLTFNYNLFDSVTISTKKYTGCPVSGTDSVKKYTVYRQEDLTYGQFFPEVMPMTLQL